MPSRWADAAPPARGILIRHFLSGLCRPRVLDDAGQEGLRRVFLGALAGAVAVGLLFTRIFAGKYAALSATRGTALHDVTLQADTAFVLAIPMLVVAALANLHADALFPDDTDYRVCMVLPVRRAVVFQSKLAALAIFIGASVAAIHVALLPLLLLMWAGAGPIDVLLRRLPVFLLVGSMASVTSLACVIAAQGIVLAALPAPVRDAGRAVLRSIILVVLIVLVPLATRLSSVGEDLAQRAVWLGAVPPLWFVAIEQILLGRVDPFHATLAWRGAVMLAGALALSVLVYTAMYRHFDAPASSAAPGLAWRRCYDVWRRFRQRSSRGSCGGVYDFAAATLWRSPLHQGVYTALTACGLGLVVQQGIGSFEAILAIPFALVLLSCTALKSSLALPHQWRANWVFRQAERPSSRPQQLRSVSALFWRAGIVMPTAVAALAQAAISGPRALVSAPVALVCGWLLMECLLRQWRRIPFTCTYLPGQRTLAHTALIVLNSYIVFTVGGVGLARAALAYPTVVAALLAILAIIAAAMRASRLQLWRTTPLEFDAADDRPQTLGIAL